MRQFLTVLDPQEKIERMAKVRKSVWDLEGDYEGQKRFLRLEAPTEFTTDVDKGKGLVFDFEGAESSTNEGEKMLVSVIRAGNAMTRESKPIQSLSATYATPPEDGSTVFKGSFSATSSGTNKPLKNRRRPNQWRRKAQSLKQQTEGNRLIQDKIVEECVTSKRKAADEAKVSSKIAKCDEGTVVPHEEPPTLR